MSDLTAAAAALGVPEAIVQRSAAARAAETGMTVDEVLAAWAGGGSVAGGAPAAEPAPAEPEAPAEETPLAEGAEAAAPTPETPAPAQPAAVPAAAAGPVTRAPIPAEVTAAEAASLPEVITVPTAGIRERTNLAIPRWMAAVMLIIPAFALFALGGSATGECGDSTELNTDVITGEVVNCDGSEFTGSGVGGGGADFIAMGEELYAGAPACDGCHGANGEGGVGPAFGGVVTTFGSCADHIEWVTLGTTGFQAEGRPTYGDTNKPVGGVGIMPSFGGSLSAEQIAAVVAFERVRFGGAAPDETLTDCGLAEPEGDEAPAESGTTVPGEEAPAESGTTVPGEEAPAEGGTTVPGEEAPADGGTTTTVAGTEAALAHTS
jgi:mono/diheme cytochrome c family protein